MKNKKRYRLLAGLVVYFLLLLILLISERSYRGDHSISTWFQAFWYSLTTLTTVGYGDLTPQSPVGQLIGMVFMLCSLGVLAFLISAFLSGLRSRILPRLMLLFSRQKQWFLFEGSDAEAAALAKNLKRSYPESVCLFSESDADDCGEKDDGIHTLYSAEELLSFHPQKQSVSVFCMGADGMQNYGLGTALAALGCRVYSMTEYEPEKRTPGLILFDPYRCCARLYWRAHPLRSPEERIVLIGAGRYAHELLEQALLSNVVSPRQHVCYTVFGGAGGFAARHPFLSSSFSVDALDDRRDSVLFRQELWKELETLREADRIIVCEDEDSAVMDRLCELRRFCPITGEVHARMSCALDGVTAFGGLQEILTPELVLQQEMNCAAIALNEVYRQLYGGKRWEELSGFLQRSNLAAADHLQVKARILLGEAADALPEYERYRAAFRVYEAVKAERADEFRRIEHERWMRFYVLNNWQFASERDNRRRFHELLLPYDQLSEFQQEKDDGGWKLLGQISGMDTYQTGGK